MTDRIILIDKEHAGNSNLDVDFIISMPKTDEGMSDVFKTIKSFMGKGCIIEYKSNLDENAENKGNIPNIQVTAKNMKYNTPFLYNYLDFFMTPDEFQEYERKESAA